MLEMFQRQRNKKTLKDHLPVHFKVQEAVSLKNKEERNVRNVHKTKKQKNHKDHLLVHFEVQEAVSLENKVIGTLVTSLKQRNKKNNPLTYRPISKSNSLRGCS